MTQLLNVSVFSQVFSRSTSRSNHLAPFFFLHPRQSETDTNGPKTESNSDLDSNADVAEWLV